MKYMIFLLLLILSTSCSISSFCDSSVKSPSDLIGPVFSAYEKKIVKSRGYIVDGTGASMPNWEVKYLFMSFVGKEKVDIPEARRRYVELVEGFVDTINENLAIRSYLENNPATWKNTKVHLDFMGKETQEKNISFISQVNGRIYYYIDDQIKKTFLDAYDEPYEEALEILRKEKENDCLNYNDN